MKLGSLFDGSGGFPLAAKMCGIEPVWASEIEPYPIAVTKKNFPEMKHLGDITKIDGGEIEPVDVITFGSPCQDLSIAGNRAGLKGSRSGLFSEAIRIINEMRAATDGKYPTFIVWENVPGAFSSNKGEDFREVIKEIAKIWDGNASVSIPPKRKWKPAGALLGDGFSLAWRVLDAQYWGVPQRRKRIFLVADFRGGRAGEILFKRKSLSGNFEEGGAEGKAAAENTEKGVGAAGFSGQAGAGAGISYEEELAPTLLAMQNMHVFGYTKTAGTLCASGAGLSRPSGQANEVDFCICIQGNVADREVRMNGRGFSENGRMYTLTAADRHCVYYGFQGFGQYKETVISKTLQACDDVTTGDLLENGSKIRRLTPLECCRLQGFPDTWEDGVSGSDSARYKMWGNGVALPCVLYVMEGIAEVMRNLR